MRLSSSAETDGTTSSDARSRSVVERILEEGLGVPVHTTTRRVWPQPKLPEVVDAWLDRYEPDLVYVKGSAYAVCKQTVALHLAGKHPRVSRLVERAGATRVVAHGLPHVPGFNSVRRGLRRTVGVAGYFEPADVVRTLESCMRAIFRREHVGLVVRAPVKPVFVTLPSARRAADERWLALHEGLRDVCRALHVPYVDEDAYWPDERILANHEPDMVHLNEAGHTYFGELEGKAMLEVARELLARSQ